MRSFVVREMSRNVGSDEPRTFWSFIASAGMTVMLGVGLAVMTILCFRPAKEIVEVAKIIREPAPPPEVVVKEVIKEVIKEVPVPVPQPPLPVVTTPVRQPWEGVWRPEKSELPMFKLKESDGTVAGIYASMAGAVLPFKGGKVAGNAIELVVDDSLFRLHFRLTMNDSESMRVESWITDEDWLVSLARGKQMIRTPQQELFVRRQLAENVKLTRKPVSLGIFCRGSEN